jgi:phage-related protein
MGMNFGQAGLVFTGKDVNLKKSVDSIADSFDSLWTKLGKVADGARGIGQRIQKGLGGAMSKGRGMLGGLSDALDSMANKANNPTIDNAFSSMNATFAKGFGETIVGMNMSAKESNKWRRVIASNSYALNADMSQTAQHWAEFRKQGLDITKVLGGKGMAGGIRTLIKFTALFGVEGKQMALMAAGLVKGFGFTQKQVRGLTADVYAMGKAFNVGKEAVQQMPGIMKLLNEELADFLKNATPKDIDKYTKSIVKMAIAFKEGLGTSMEDGTELAKNLFKVLMTERKSLIDKFRGLGDKSLSPLIKGLSEATGPAQAFQLVMKDLPKFIAGLHKAMEKAKKEGGVMGVEYQRLSGILNKVAGPDATYLAKGNWKKSAKAMSKLDKISMNTMANVKALTKAIEKNYKTGLTKGDAYTRMLQEQERRLHALSEPKLNEWIANQKKGFDTVFNSVQKLAAKSGPVGELTKRLLLVQRVGLSGFFGSKGMGGMAPMLMKTLQTMGPMLAALAHMGVALSMVGKLLLPGGIILVGLALFNEKLRKKLLDTVKKVWDFLAKKIPEYWPKLKKGIVELWKKAIVGVKWAMDVVSPMIVRLAEAIGKVDWGGLTMKVVGYLGRFFRGVFDALFGGGGAFSPDTSTAEGRFMAAGIKLAKALGAGMKQVLMTVLGEVWKFFTDWSSGLEGGLREKGRTLGGIFIVAMFFGQTRALMWKGMLGIIKGFAWLFLQVLVRTQAHQSVMTALELKHAAKMKAIQEGSANLTLALWAKTWIGVQASAAWASAKSSIGNFFKWIGTTAKMGFMKAHVAAIAFFLKTKLMALTNAPIIGSAITFMFGPVGLAIMGIAGLAVAFYVFRDKLAVIAPIVGALMTWMFGPIGLAIVAIAALGVAFYMYRDKMAGWAKDVWKYLKYPFMFFWGYLIPLVKGIMKLFQGDYKEGFKLIGIAVFKFLTFPFWKSLMVMKWFYQIFKTQIDSAIAWVKHAAFVVYRYLTFPFRMLWKLVTLIFSQVEGAFWTYVGVVKAVGGFVYDFLTYPIRMWWEHVAKPIMNALGIAWDAVVGGIKETWDGAVAWLSDKFAWIGEAAANAWKDLVKVVTAVVDGIKAAWKAVVEWLDEKWDYIKAGAKNAWNSIGSTASSAWSKIRGAASNAHNYIVYGDSKTTFAMSSNLDKLAKKFAAAEMSKQINATKTANITKQVATDAANAQSMLENQLTGVIRDNYGMRANDSVSLANQTVKNTTHSANETQSAWNQVGGEMSGIFGGIGRAGSRMWNAVTAMAKESAKETLAQQAIVLKATGKSADNIEAGLKALKARRKKAGGFRQESFAELKAGSGVDEKLLKRLKVMELKGREQYMKAGSYFGFTQKQLQANLKHVTRDMMDAVAKAQKIKDPKIRAWTMKQRVREAWRFAKSNLRQSAQKSYLDAYIRKKYGYKNAAALEAVDSAKLDQAIAASRKAVRGGALKGKGIFGRGGRGMGGIISGGGRRIGGRFLASKGKAGSGVTGIGPGGERRIEKKEVVEKKLSADTKAAMVDVGLELKGLSSAIRDLSDFKIVITGDIGRFLNVAKRKLAAGAGSSNPQAYS